MSLDFQQVQQQVHQLGDAALRRTELLGQRMAEAKSLLEERAQKIDALQGKVKRVVEQHDPSLRCAVPVSEHLDTHRPCPALPAQATLLAADGSQIFMDRHAQVEYSLVNVGAIQLQLFSGQPPQTHVACRLYYHEQAETMSEAMLALQRDLEERKYLVELAQQVHEPLITFTDGPMELWGAKGEGGEEARKFQESLEEYLGVLSSLEERGVTTAGYVDKPGADLVVRLLEVARAAESELPALRKSRPLRGVADRSLFREWLAAGERSAVFAIQSQSIRKYAGPLSLHFFYLNAASPGQAPHLARVEVPAWVANHPQRLDALHAVLVDQCRILGARPYPYLLHRAHETAVVTRQDQEQVTQMILLELQRRGVEVEGQSYKQAAKDHAGRTRYTL
jgi:hypothetical protein